MNTFDESRLRVLIVRPGQTELDEQGRIAGSLDVPLSEIGIQQIEKLAKELDDVKIDRVFAGPSAAARQSAEIIADAQSAKIKIKIEDELKNLDYGLWHGMRIDELKDTQPKLFKLWQEQPESVFPPNGETVEQTKTRVEKFAKKLVKKAKPQTIIVVAAEPIACILRSILESVDLAQYWTVEANCATWVEVAKDFQAV